MGVVMQVMGIVMQVVGIVMQVAGIVMQVVGIVMQVMGIVMQVMGIVTKMHCIMGFYIGREHLGVRLLGSKYIKINVTIAEVFLTLPQSFLSTY